MDNVITFVVVLVIFGGAGYYIYRTKQKRKASPYDRPGPGSQKPPGPQQPKARKTTASPKSNTK